MVAMPKITPWLWFDTEGEEAATHYCSIFKNSRITGVTYYGPGGMRPEGTVMTVSFELDGAEFVALNGGPEFTFSEAVSFKVDCADQAELDYFWDRLGEDGEHGPCGWLKDKFGLSWQIVPTALGEILGDPDPAKAEAAMKAMLAMGKLDIDALQRARDSV
jgi:predicted 3-demethylubiquinone-9 3-methyltransferase (glyoxalase superfamily)